MINHYENNSDILFGSCAFTEASFEYQTAWQTTFDTLGKKLGYISKELMQRQIKDWLHNFKERMVNLDHTEESIPPRLNEYDTALYNLMKKLPQKYNKSVRKFI